MRMQADGVCIYRPAYIAGVTNPIFETSGSWDLLMDVGTGRVVVSKDIHISFPVVAVPPAIMPLIPRTGIVRAENSGASEEEIARIATRDGAQSNQKSDFAARPDSLDNVFIEDVRVFSIGEKACHMIGYISSLFLPSRHTLVRRWCDCGSPNMLADSCGLRRGTRKSRAARRPWGSPLRHLWKDRWEKASCFQRKL